MHDPDVAGQEALEAHRASLPDAPLHSDANLDRIGRYRGYAELVTGWSELSRAGARVRCIGRSVAGAPLFALRVGAERAPLTSIMLAGTHPIEWIGVETLHALLLRFVAAPPADRAILAVPLLNVDGYRRVEADLRAGRRRWRRSNDNRVDLNRNWPTFFKRARFFKQGLVAGWNHGGPHPLSEPEVAAVAALLDERERTSRIDLALSLHSAGRKILIPYAGRWRAPVNGAAHRHAAAAVQRRLAEGYGVRQCARWVPGAFAHGTELDHLHERYGATTLLVECRGGGVRLRDPWTWLHPFCWFNPRDPARVSTSLADALKPFLRGRDQ